MRERGRDGEERIHICVLHDACFAYSKTTTEMEEEEEGRIR